MSAGKLGEATGITLFVATVVALIYLIAKAPLWVSGGIIGCMWTLFLLDRSKKKPE